MLFNICHVMLYYFIYFMSFHAAIVLETFGTFKRGNSHCLVQCRMRSAASVDVAGTSVCSTARNPLGTLWQEPSPEFQQAYWYIYIYVDDSWVLTVDEDDEGTCCIPAKDDPGPSPPLPSSLAASRQVPGEAYNSGSGLCYVTGVQMCPLSVHMGTFSGWQIRFQIIEFRCNEQL